MFKVELWTLIDLTLSVSIRIQNNLLNLRGKFKLGLIPIGFMKVKRQPKQNFLTNRSREDVPQLILENV